MPRTRLPSSLSASAGPDDALQLGVGVEPEVAVVATDAAHLETAEGGLVIALGGVDADVAGLQLLGDRVRASRVLRVHVVVEAVVAVVGDGDRLLVVVE